MRVLLLTNWDRTVPSSRMWFYQMHELLLARGYQVDLNTFGNEPYDIAVVFRCIPDLVHKVLLHSPNAHVGVFHPVLEPLVEVNSNVDFYIIASFLWKELLLPFNRRVYQHFDFFDPRGKECKEHVKRDNLILGYHGNEIHYSKHFFPNVADALRRLASEFDFTLKVVIANPGKKPRISGVKSVFVPWELETFEKEIASFDIGLCPALSHMSELSEPNTYIRNPNRNILLLFYGIPSITSPIPQNAQVLEHGKTAFFAISETGWYHYLRELMLDPDLRNRIGRAGCEMVNARFSFDAAAEAYVSILIEEMKQPLFKKNTSLLVVGKRPPITAMLKAVGRRLLKA